MLAPSRSGTLADVMEDACGPAVMLVVALPYWDHLRNIRQLASKS
jgi:hypothetical protein